ncbi:MULTISPECIES: hypothetical protein [Actinoalloteichus]|uniref:Uncharacterized protein n=1 Tax=Actinoalloteichus fjordicus TaxID=1612552 RepID=A0AAC9LC29_9PSEU|nr:MULTISPECIES: hypothetical protein [Actinoalloteichus]APU14100.1 hypothetical protein UA74_10185 [Actinoalloteichus fjordicus]APU20048.1 hypothetical protein UA75_10165 [Actinoalloteichus sp. GBA129-24]
MTEGFLGALVRALARNTPAFDPPRAQHSDGRPGLRAALARNSAGPGSSTSDGGPTDLAGRTDRSRMRTRRERDSAASVSGLPRAAATRAGHVPATTRPKPA